MGRFPASALMVCACLSMQAQEFVPSFETWDVDRGLSTNSVYQVHQDRYGFIWFGTSEGLNRFDGRQVRSFSVNRGSVTPANSGIVRGVLCEDSHARLWFVNESGIYVYNPVNESIGIVRDFIEQGSSVITYYQLVCLDQEERLWIIDPTKGLISFSTRDHSWIEFKLPFVGNSTDYVERATSRGHEIFLSTTTQMGCLRFNILTGVYDWPFLDQKSVDVIPTESRLFVVKNDELFEYDSLSTNLIPMGFNVESRIGDLVEDSQHRLWVATIGGGLHVLDPNSNSWRRFGHDPANIRSLPIDVTRVLCIDANENLWVGTDGGGVARADLKSQQFNLFPVSPASYPELHDFFIRCFLELNDGSLLVGTLHDGVLFFEPGFESPPSSSRDSPGVGENVSALYEDRNGQIWVGHEHGISTYDRKTNRFRDVPIGSSNKSALSHVAFLESPNGEMLALGNYGVLRLEPTANGAYRVMPWKGSLSSTFGIVTDPAGIIWVASESSGLMQTAKKSDSVSLSGRIFERVIVRSVHQDETQPAILWICTSTGLIRFDTRNRSYRAIGEKEGIPPGCVYAVLEDDAHNFWMSTNAGLWFWNRSTNEAQFFTHLDGLQSNEFNTNAAYKSASGNLYFGGIKGFNWFRSGAEKFARSMATARVIEVTVNEQPASRDSTFYFNRSLSLAHDANDLVFQWAVFDYTKPEAIRSRYRLEGWDDRWIQTSQRLARYSNLPPGFYTFSVRGSTNGVDWGQADQVSIWIATPFWQSWWFYGGMFAVAFLSIVLVTRFLAQLKLQQKLEKMERERLVLQERERISKDIHDDLGSGLSKISILSDLAQQSDAEEYKRRQLEKISKSSHELIDNLSELIWSHNPANDSILKMLGYIREHFGLLFDGTSTELEMELPEISDDRPVTAIWRRSVFLAMKEALHNVLKHAQATKAVLKMEIKESKVVIQVFDNGIGFNAEDPNPGNGLKNISVRITELGGTIALNSRPHEGSTVRMEIPVGS